MSPRWPKLILAIKTLSINFGQRSQLNTEECHEISTSTTLLILPLNAFPNLNVDIEAELLKILGLEHPPIPQPTPERTNVYPENTQLNQVCFIPITYIKYIINQSSYGPR